MPAVLALLVNLLRVVFATQLGRWIVSSLAFLGLTYGAQKVIIQPTLDLVTSLLTSGAGGGTFGARAMEWLGVLKFDIAISMLVSAIIIKQGAHAARAVLSMKPT